MKDTFYFSHDYNARNDSKIKKLISKHGFLGYGIFWAVVEDLYNNANALPTDYESIAFDLRSDAETIKSIITDFDLFAIEGKNFGSHSIEKRLDERNAKSKKAQKSAFARWNKAKVDANALRTQSECNAIKERKGKEIKGKEDNIHFDTFWNLYNKKEGDKNACIKKWDKIIETEKQKIIDTLPNFLSNIKDKQFQPLPATYLNQKRWNDIIENNKMPVKKQLIHSIGTTDALFGDR